MGQLKPQNPQIKHCGGDLSPGWICSLRNSIVHFKYLICYRRTTLLLTVQLCSCVVYLTFALFQNLYSFPNLQDQSLTYWWPEVADHCAQKEKKKSMKNSRKIFEIIIALIDILTVRGNHIRDEALYLLSSLWPLIKHRCHPSAAVSPHSLYFEVVAALLISCLMQISKHSVTQEPLLSKL